MKPSTKKILSLLLWIIFVFLALVVGLYPGFYFLLDRKFSLLAYKDDALLTHTLWNIAFYTHITTGGFSLLIGWLQFSRKLRLRFPALHRNIGKSYICSSLISTVAGFYLALFATGGIVSLTGFALLSLFWFYTTLMAFINARNTRILQHRKMAFYSYAACFAAVTLRLWLHLLIHCGMDFLMAYRIAAWLSWLPNVIAANILVNKKNKTILQL